MSRRVQRKPRKEGNTDILIQQVFSESTRKESKPSLSSWPTCRSAGARPATDVSPTATGGASSTTTSTAASRR
jgi:hypothetical protein